MNNRIYIGTFSKNALDTIKKYRCNIELNHICISENLNEDRIETTIESMKYDWEKSGAKDAIVHGPFTELIPASIDSRAREMGLKRLEEAYHVCQSLNVNHMVVHTGYIPCMYHRDWHITKSGDFWKAFMENKPEDFKISIENVFEEDPLIMEALLTEIRDSRVKICLDIGHANMSKQKGSNVKEWVNILGENVSHVHLHNNYGVEDSHNSLEEGDMDILEMIKLISKKTDNKATMTIESKECETSANMILTKKQL